MKEREREGGWERGREREREKGIRGGRAAGIREKVRIYLE